MTGGFSLGLERTGGFETVAFCEIDKFCQKVLKKHWPDVPIHDDITKLDGKQYHGTVDIICGGFPCQPFSFAGKRAGKKDDRYLWPEMFRIIKECKPNWIIGENVAGFVNMALDQALFDLESEGYTCQAFIIPACAIDAPHRRDRVWIIAYTNSQRCQGSESQSLCGQQAFSWCKDVRRLEDYFNRPDIPEPLICRDSNGFSSRVDRLRALGNAVVPQIPEILGNAILEVINEQAQRRQERPENHSGDVKNQLKE